MDLKPGHFFFFYTFMNDFIFSGVGSVTGRQVVRVYRKCA